MQRATRPIFVLASAVLLLAVSVAAQKTDSAQALLRIAMDKAVVEGDLNGAIKQYQRIVDRFKTDRAVVATALVQMAECYRKLGDAQARTIYERVAREFADQKEASAEARTRIAALQSPAIPSAGQTARQIWAGDGANEYASVSPDGRYMSFVGFGVEDVGVRDLLTGTIRRLTNEANYRQSDGRDVLAEYSVISRDGRQVAYMWYMPAEPPPGRKRQGELRILPLTGAEASQPRVVLRTGYLEVFDWTPDGKNLLVLLNVLDQTRQIAFVSIADGSVHALKTLVRDRETPWVRPDKVSLSPDGRYVAYDTPRRDGEPARDIFVLAADGSQETVAVEHRANDWRPVWSADGSQLLFVSDRSGKNALWVVPIDRGRPTGPAVLIKEELGGIVPLGTTRTGVLHYVVEGQQRSNVYVAALDEGSKVTGAPAFATGRFVGSNGGPAWSHDGQYLAYRVSRESGVTLDTRSTDTLLVIRTLKTGEERDVPLSLRVDPQGGAGLKWFPDGRSVLVVAQERTPELGRHHVFYRVDVASGRAELLLSTRGTYYEPSDPGLSPDGRTIYYVHGEDKERPVRQLVRFDLESRRETILKRGQLVSPRVAVSPDGAEVAYLVKNPSSSRVEIEVMPAGGGEPRQVFLGTSRSGDDPLEGLTWTPDQRSLLFVRTGARPFSLWRVAATGGEPENMGISGLLTPRVHPDGRRIAFEVREDLPSSVWTLENFLPKTGANVR